MLKKAVVLTVVLVLPLVFVMRLMLGGVTYAAGFTVIVDGKQLEIAGVIDNGRTLVPLRAVFEALGTQVTYDQGVIAVAGSQADVRLRVGSRTADVNGRPHLLDVPSRIVDGRTMVPFRFLAEALDCKVEWKPAGRTVVITSPGAPGTGKKPPTPPAAGMTKDFGFNLFAALAKEDAGENIFVSPVSVALALSMVYNGADTETKKAMAEVLGVQGVSVEDLNKTNQALLKALNSPAPGVRLDVANSLWAKQDAVFVAEFLETVKRYYSAEVAELDFIAPEAPAVINKWVQDKTNGKIDKIVERIDPDDVMYLINAIYFLGTWTTEFDRAETREQPFYPAGRAREQVPMMSKSGDFRYFRDANFEAVELPYGKDQSAGMYIFLPSRDSNLEEFQRNLNAANWTMWQSRFATKEGRISLPRFSIEYEKTLNEILSGMGMGIAFQPYAADFSKLLTPPPQAYIGEVKHKAVVDVDERGTEAAAVTSISVRVVSLRPDETFNMVVDRPFFFAIVDKQTDTLLFMGSVTHP
ncbi:MAG: hypothetical protein DDT21_00426 [Syntrophomonadaceae bacterium]|nr:hypothetical protein [Bacillota bacterium]